MPGLVRIQHPWTTSNTCSIRIHQAAPVTCLTIKRETRQQNPSQQPVSWRELTDEPERTLVAELVPEAASEGVRDELPRSLAAVKVAKGWQRAHEAS